MSEKNKPNDTKNYLDLMGFKLKDGTECSYSKTYIDNYEIIIAFDESSPEKSQIDYGKKIKTNRKTACNFSQEENLVVLECINRLLEKGYKPESIELEKSWNLGHRGKGFLDILVKDKTRKSFLMIECKTWGTEYEKEKQNTLNRYQNQIFSYLHQEPRTTKAVCLYTVNLKSLEYKNSIIYNKEDWANLNQEERYLRWKGIPFEENGIFEDWVSAYSLNSKALLRKDLKSLTKEDGNNIYNKFAEILRHNVISDKGNAFNKIINLFLAKIYDENTNPNDELKFQTRKGIVEKTDEELLSDLSDLYTKGMKFYLKKDIEDYTAEQLEEIIKTNDKEKLREVYKVLRLYKDNVFAFREVFDKQSFTDNAKVVREVVELLQKKRIRYSHKQQFLGDFFEKLLKDSIKQESGQFFTPVPITQFVIKSLPIDKIIKENISRKEDNILPFTIDYAMGSGHFLTEIMDEYNKIIEQMPLGNLKPSIKRQVKGWQENQFDWAEEYVYGIDLDYRLVKTSKIACFLNGDGLAQVIHADGLDNFSKSETYKGLLKTSDNKQDNPKFDILLSNPPYSVKAFRNTLKNGKDSFKLFDSLTDDSREIECLFIERAKQLLKDNAVAGIILPISVLTNGGIYEKAREIILQNFDIKAIISLGSNAFMATGTKTIILFLQKKNIYKHLGIEKQVDTFLNDYRDVVVNGIQKAFSVYVSSVYEDIELKDYISVLKQAPTDKAKTSELFKEYKGIEVERIKTIEREKLIYFMTAYPQKVVLGDSKEKDIEKEFYGYEFSNRRGYEGIHIYKDEEGNIVSKLYDLQNLLNNEKMNSYVLRNFNNDNKIEKDIGKIKTNEEHPLKNHIEYLRLSDLMNFDVKTFDKSINNKKIKIESKYALERVSTLCSLGRGRVINKNYIKKHPGKYPLYSSQTSNNGILGYVDSYDFDGEYATWTTDGAKAGTLFYRKGKFSCTNVCGTLKAKSNSTNMRYLVTFLNTVSKHYVNYVGNPKLMNEDMAKIKIPLPPITIQDKIASEIEKIEKQEELTKNKIRKNRENIKKLIQDNNFISKKIKEIQANIISGATPSKKIIAYWDKKEINWATIEDLGNKYITNTRQFISRKGLKKVRIVPRNSVLLSCTATIGCLGINKIELTTNQQINSIICNSKIIPEYLYFILGTKKEELSSLTDNVGVKHINLKMLKNFKIPLPPIEEQERILKQVEPLEKEIEKAEKYLENSKLEKQKILDRYLK